MYLYFEDSILIDVSHLFPFSMVCRLCDFTLYVFSQLDMAMVVLINGFPFGQLSIPSFQGQGFSGWKAKMLLILEGDELFNVVIGNFLCPP